MVIFGVPLPELVGQLVLGLINGSFYAILSLGLAIIFGLMNVINFVHGTLYMMGALMAWAGGYYLGIGYWWSLLLVPITVGLVGVVLEFLLIRRVSKEDHLFLFLLTFGIALILQSVFRVGFGAASKSYSIPKQLFGGLDFGMVFIPYYRLWIVAVALVVCVATWLIIERTKVGAYLRAASEDAALLGAFGVNVPVLLTLTYGFGAGLAALAGVLAAPIYAVNPLMGNDILIVVFAIVVIGGMGSLAGAIFTGYLMGVVEAIFKVFYPEAASVAIFIAMIVVLTLRPSGLFGKMQADG